MIVVNTTNEAIDSLMDITTKALGWWNNLSKEEQDRLWEKHNGHRTDGWKWWRGAQHIVSIGQSEEIDLH